LGVVQEYIINNANISVLVVGGPRAHRSQDTDSGDDGDSRFEVLQEALGLAASCPSLKIIISMEEPASEHLERAQQLVRTALTVVVCYVHAWGSSPQHNPNSGPAAAVVCGGGAAGR
jgi:hypothetical protein